jgi:AcrR family transcriptional regulator
VDNSRARPSRSTYRHGNLRSALVAVGVELARRGGPGAVVLREATRRVGVAPNAAYRHFADRDALLEAVGSAAQAELAGAIEAELAAVPDAGEPADIARARLRAVGAGYLSFARSEPGLFRTAFSVPTDLRDATSPERAGQRGLTPFQLLAATLDELVVTGFLAPARRPDAEYVAWSALHGLAVLLLNRPLRGFDPARTQAIEKRLLNLIEQGL